ncbi:MAG: FtsX-like permease family protein [Bacteroidaceae bacterium]|nr:FtsX-like permease family protein [Bacteroidaceae bacterium]
MNFPFYVARRYLFAKKSHHAINIISGISVCGVALATMALICTLSVFNGFHDMVATFFTVFDPELKVLPVEGKRMNKNDKAIQLLRENNAIEVLTEVLEDNALITNGTHQAIVTLKGVEDNFIELTDIGTVLYGDGAFQLHAGELHFGVMGIQLTQQLNVNARFESPLEVYAPKRGEKVNLANPAASFNQDQLHSPGVVFSTLQAKYDNHYVLTDIAFARQLFDAPDALSAVEIRCRDGVNVNKVKKDIQNQLGDGYRVLDRYEQQADVFRIMEIEKLLSYVFLTFILVIACFNIVGSLSMLIIDKKADVVTLRNLGANDQQICSIFLFEGRMISAFGAISGTVLGLLLCWGQQAFGWLSLGDASGSFVIDAYPVSVHFWDVALVFFTVTVVGYLSVWYPVHYLSRRLL